MKSLIGLTAISCLMMGCVSLTASDNSVCTTNSVAVPSYSGVPSGVSGIEATVTASTTFDVSSAASKLNSFGTVNSQIIQDVLGTNTGDLMWVKHLWILMKSSSDPTDYPSITLVDQDVAAYDSTQSVSLNTLVDSNTVFNYLAQGEVELDFTIIGSVPDTNSLNMTLCVAVSDSIHKSL